MYRVEISDYDSGACSSAGGSYCCIWNTTNQRLHICINVARLPIEKLPLAYYKETEPVQIYTRTHSASLWGFKDLYENV